MRLFDMDSTEDYLLDGKYKVATPFAPCVDVAEVTRCKDCKNRARYAVCDFLGEDGFCSHGEPLESEVEE